MLRLVPISTAAPPRPQPSPRPPSGTLAKDYAGECLARGPVFATASGAFEALLDWVEGRP